MASADVKVLQEKANFTRLSRLLIDKGTEAFRSAFDTIHSPANLYAVLAANKKSLLKLKPRVINDSQWDLLFPPSGNPPDSKTFDVTLLTVLFRNICGLSSTGWGVMPPDTDRSLQANITRIKLYRNKVYAHVTSTQVDHTTFQSLWQKIGQALVEMKIPEQDVDDLKVCPLGPEEVVYAKMLEDWEDGCKESDEDILRKLAKHNFKGKITRKVESFMSGTRKWLFKEVDTFVNTVSESRILLLTAGPGFGKSVFAAKVCEDYKKKGTLAASHFCDFNNSNLRGPMVMLQSLASQMCENVEGFKEKLLDQLKRPHQVRNLKDAFKVYLQNPLDELELKESRLIVIDGLDESAADSKNEIVDLICDYFEDLPKYIKILVTSRPEITLGKVNGVQAIDVKRDDFRNNSDIELYLKACLPILTDMKAAKLSDVQVIDTKNKDFDNNADIQLYFKTCLPTLSVNQLRMLRDKCEGSFLYAFCIQSDLNKRDDLKTMTFEQISQFLPQGMDSIYEAYFKRLEDELRSITKKNVDLLRILEILAVSEGPLPLVFITRAIDLAPDCRETKNIISNVKEAVSCLLYISNDQVTVFHKSVIDWLLAKGYKDHEFAVDVCKGNESLWKLCEQSFKEIKKTVLAEHDFNCESFSLDLKYALNHGLWYLVAGGLIEGKCFWSVDVIIIYVLLTVNVQNNSSISLLFHVWEKILQGASNKELRERVSWHVIEVQFLLRATADSLHSSPYLQNLPIAYLQSVFAHSPRGCFSDEEKRIARSLSSKIQHFVEFNFYDAEGMALVFPLLSESEQITAFSISHEKTMAAVAFIDGVISVFSVPYFVKLWSYPTRYGRIPCCLFAPDDSLVLFGKLETALSIDKRKELPFLRGTDETFVSGAFSPNGNRLVTCDNSCTVKLWDISKQCLLSSLNAGVQVNWCTFSSTGLYIIADETSDAERLVRIDSDDLFADLLSSSSDDEDSSCWTSDCDRDLGSDVDCDQVDSFRVWNAITWQRSDVRNIPDELRQNRQYKQCFQLEFQEETLRISGERNVHESGKILALDDLLFCTELETLTVVKKLAVMRQGQTFLFQRPALVLWCSFSPDGSRLATCLSTGCIEIWDVYTSQIKQRFQSNRDVSFFACWWSEKFLFVFEFADGVPNLSRYSVYSLEISFFKNQQIPLYHLVDEFKSLSAILDFSEGVLSFECGETKPVKVLDVSGGDCPQIIFLEGIRPKMNITVSPGASFIFGGDSNFFFWKKNASQETSVYNLMEIEYFGLDFYMNDEGIPLHYCKPNYRCCFSNDCKVAVVVNSKNRKLRCFIIDLISDDYIESYDIQRQSFYDALASSLLLPRQLLCIKSNVLAVSSKRTLRFYDTDSGALLASSFQRYLTADFLKQTKVSPNENVIAFPKRNGDMMFVRFSIPPEPLLSDVKRDAAIRLESQSCGNEDYLEELSSSFD